MQRLLERGALAEKLQRQLRRKPWCTRKVEVEAAQKAREAIPLVQNRHNKVNKARALQHHLLTVRRKDPRRARMTNASAGLPVCRNTDR